jgi:phage tail-like protein
VAALNVPTMTAANAAESSVVIANRFVIQVTLALGGKSTQGDIAFSELQGITSEVEAAEYHASSLTGVNLSKQYGRTKPATVTLKRGVDQNTLLWDWHQAVLDGNPQARASCSLLLQDTTGETKATYQLRNAWPSKIDIGGMKAGGSEVVYATATLVCDQIVFGGATATPTKPSS